MRILAMVLLTLGFVAHAPGSALPGNLSDAEVGKVVGLVGPLGAMRLMRAADAYPSWPGIKIGVETILAPAYDINTLGDGKGSLPTISPVPRLYFSKGLFFNTDLTICYLPANLINTLATLGLGLRYTFADEKENWFAAATYFNFTAIDAYDSTFKGNDYEAGVVVSKDYVRAKPYLGAGFLLASASVMTAQQMSNSVQVVVHSYFGVELEFPVNVTLQFDLMDFTPSGSLLFGFHI